MAEASPIDLLRRFGGGSGESSVTAEGSSSGDVELSLALSLGGSFSARERGALVRASSVASFSTVVGDRGEAPVLTRACSMPAVAEEMRRRKEMQSLRRMEAKRKRSEKRVLRVSGSAGADAGCSGANWMRERAPVLRGGSQGSCSGVGGSSCPPVQGNGSSSEAKSMSNARSSSINSSQKKLPAPAVAAIECPANCTREETVGPSKEATERTEARAMMEQMPCVSTRGHGPNGKRIDGFLYKYGKGEEVRIVCVCHGSFLTPAEFVKHAGGGDVDHPLRHIVVNPSPPMS